MKRVTTLYYLLFVLLIFGAFASMAQNVYGQKILGGVALIFCVLFISQLVSQLREEQRDFTTKLESISLIVLSVILAMRVFYLRFPFVEIFFGVAGVGLMTVYLRKLLQSWHSRKNTGGSLTFLIIIFYGSLILYILSMVSVAFYPILSEPAGGLAFGFLIIFVAFGFVSKEFMVTGEKISVFKFIQRFTDRSVVLAILFLLFTAYMGLTKIKVLPKMYSNEFPQAYFDLVKEAEAGKEIPVNGLYRHELFKKEYDLFIQKRSQKK